MQPIYLPSDLPMRGMPITGASALPRPATGAFDSILGRSPALLRILQQVEVVAATKASVLIFGESGTGKELIARSIHARSRRKGMPLVKVNCASIPQELFESEFFGHVRGSFTGAVRDRVGRFQAADGGSLFLDEVGEIPLSLQSKLLRVLQEGEFERVGEDRTRQVDVRMIAATNRVLPEEIREGRFRQDLYYRLSAFPIVVPPLRERKDDIPMLTAHFLERAGEQFDLPVPELTPAHLRLLMDWDWPGNVRELQHVVERALILGRGRTLPFDFAEMPGTRGDGVVGLGDQVLTAREMQDLEVRNYRNALKRAQGRIYGATGAAALLGLPPTTLASRLKTLGIADTGGAH